MFLFDEASGMPRAMGQPPTASPGEGIALSGG
jgi:hypothetical protein